MSDIGLNLGRDDEPEHDPLPETESVAPRERRPSAPGARRAPRRKARRARSGCLPVLIALLILAVIGYFAVSWGAGRVKDLLGGAPDYAGPGSGSVIYKVDSGATSADIARGLKAKSVVKSVKAFTEAANADPKSREIQVGYYQLKRQMKAKDALAVLVDHQNLIQSLVVVPEGARVKQIVKTITTRTKIPAAAVDAALRNPQAIGLPAQAHGNPEGYLFPATYTVVPGETAVALLRAMVAKAVAVEQDLDLQSKARKVGLTPEQVITFASILEYEASRDKDYPKVARAIYNRLDRGMKLQSDATVAYASSSSGSLYTSDQQRASDSAYNTYKHGGLPPGPIGSPGEKTIKAALNPSAGDQLFWVVVNLKTGETRYADNYADHQKNVELFRTYCKTSDAC